MKIIFWFCVLQPFVFGLFYSTTAVLKNLTYAHFNYYTHRPGSNGAEVLNLDTGIFYKFLNSTTFGLYHHKSHHLNPNLFNPALFEERRKERVRMAREEPEKVLIPN